jgi:hypothetical protein
MAFPYLVNEDFSTGTLGDFDTETDTAGIIDFPHYRTLARWGLAPFQGAYCMRALLTGGTTSGYVIETGGYDVAADGSIFTSFMFLLGHDFTMADTDKLMLHDLESTLNTTSEIACGLIRDGANINFWFSETAAAAAQTFTLGTLAGAGDPMSCKNRWFHVELAVVLDDGGTNDGTINAYINGKEVGSQITGLDQAAIVNGRLGAIGPDAGTKGTILFDRVIADDARIYPPKERFPVIVNLTESRHVFVGPGDIASAALLTVGASNVMRLWDTDVANIDDEQGFKTELNVDVHLAVEGPLHFDRGCYVQLSGTAPRGQVILVQDSDTLFVLGPLAYTEEGIIRRGLARREKSYGI